MMFWFIFFYKWASSNTSYFIMQKKERNCWIALTLEYQELSLQHGINSSLWGCFFLNLLYISIEAGSILVFWVKVNVQAVQLKHCILYLKWLFKLENITLKSPGASHIHFNVHTDCLYCTPILYVYINILNDVAAYMTVL